MYFPSHIVLAIPHATGSFDTTLWSDPEAVERDARLWTDWYTDALYTKAAHDNPQVRSVVGRISRFDCDLERLEHDPMESVGQGRLYTRSMSGATRHVSQDRATRWVRAWEDYRAAIRFAAFDCPRPLLLDCHSFPSMLAPEVDVCLGFNDDASRPGEWLLERTAAVFSRAGLRVSFNTPYSNALRPDGYDGVSLCIELRKGLYMEEDTLRPTRKNSSSQTSWEDIHGLLHTLYSELLAIPDNKTRTL